MSVQDDLGRTLSELIGHHQATDIPPKQIEDIVRKTVEAYRKRAAPQTERLFMELETDPAIAGIGVTQKIGERPAHIIPRIQFHDWATGHNPGSVPLAIDHQPQPRMKLRIETLTLVSPVPLQSKRKWRFIGKEGEFGATVKDEQFLDDVQRGRSAIPMVAGIRMEVELQTLESPFEGIWIVRNRNILRVRRVTPPSIQLTIGSIGQSDSGAVHIVKSPRGAPEDE